MTMPEKSFDEKRVVVFYHGSSCSDGFGAAYAAWKKFGDGAEYHPLERGEEPPYALADGAEVYFADFVYDSIDVMKRFEEITSRLVVLDHHSGAREVTESVSEHVFDNDRSGAGITWDYFHPGVKRPKLIDYVEDMDIYRFALSDTKVFGAYLETVPLNFHDWDKLAIALDDENERAEIMKKAAIYREYFDILAHNAVGHAKKVSFEGMEILFASSPSFRSLRSHVGHLLAVKQGPCAIVVSAHPKGYGVSIRGDGSIDVSAIARKYGGNGHRNASGFFISREGPFPWEYIDNKEIDSTT